MARPHETQIIGLCTGDELTERYICYSGSTGSVCRSDLITGNVEVESYESCSLSLSNPNPPYKKNAN